ncbi:MAG: folate-binding protein YgfZ [Magnetococcales bacterium]|nr:folate-binding protein YgfZ [Magnetococcales bacterium]
MSQLQSHLEGRASWAEDRGQATPASFGSTPDELVALGQGAALIDLSHTGLVSVGGPERQALLSGLITNQVRDVSESCAVYTALLTAQGRCQWDFTMLAYSDSDVGEQVILVTEPGEAANLVGRLLFYRMRTKADVADATEQYGVLGLAGPEAEARLQALHPEMALQGAALGATFSAEGGIRLWRDPRHAAYGWRLMVPSARLPELWDVLAGHFTPVGHDAWTHYRIAAMLPRAPFDLRPDITMPLEVGLDELNGVSFSKGCYVGQETLARAHHRGTIKHRLYGLTVEDGHPASSGVSVLLESGKEVGAVGSVSKLEERSIGLATLRVSDVESGNPMTLEGHPVRVGKPDWAKW